MFVILKIVQSEKKSIRKGRTVNDVRLIKMTAGSCFYEVEAIAGEKGVNWQEVADVLGRHSSNILLADDVILPEECSVKRFCADEFRNILIFNTLELIFKELFFMGERVSCIINDPTGKYASYIGKIVRYASRTTVVTDNEFRYFADIRQMYSYYGAGVVLATEIGELRSDSIYIDTAGTLNAQNVTVFSPSAGFSPYLVDGHSDLKAFCPSYINQTDFLGAVMSLNGEKALRQAVCRTFGTAEKSFTVYETARYIAMQKNGCSACDKSIIFYV